MVRLVKREKGITLIALVITIIVLLILAGVSISMLTGKNGILTRAKESEIYTNIAEIEEQAKLKITELKMNEALNEKDTINGIAEDLIETGDLKRIVKQEDDGKTYLYYLVIPGKLGNNSKNENLVQARDVYGLNNDLTGYYIDKSGKMYGNTSSKIELVDDQVIKFFSKELKELTQKALGITSDEITYGELKRIDKLTISDPNITDLSDLIFFTGLKQLYLNDLKLKNLEGIENCKQLAYFNANRCTCISQSYLELGYLTNLTNIQWNYDTSFNFENFITSISNLEKIRELRVAADKITSIEKLKDIKSIGNITYLSVEGNQISDISVIKGFTSLTNLYLTNNSISNIEPISELVNLKYVYLDNNDIKDVTAIATLKKLKELYIAGNANINVESLNKIVDIINNLDRFSIDMDFIDKINNLKKLILNYKDLGNEDVEKIKDLTSLEVLSLAGNPKITDISPLENLENLTYLHIGRTSVTNIKPLANLKKLKNLYLGALNDINLKDIENIIPNLTALQVSDKALETIVTCNNITSLNISWSGLTKLPDLTKLEGLETLNISNNNISDLSVVSKLVSLKSLKMTKVNSDNKINMPNLNQLTNLETLNLDNNYLTSEDLRNISGLKNIKELYLQNNSIRDVSNLANLTTLKNLYLTGNLIKDFTPLDGLVGCDINKGTQR